MQQNRILIAVFFAVFPVFATTLLAQTSKSNTIVRLTSNAVTANFTEMSCGFLGTEGWGGTFLSEFCAPVVWAKDGMGNDSLCCDSIPVGSLEGKIALIRRGVCEFGRKAINAQKAGAIAVIIVNHFNVATDNGCTQLRMASGFGGEPTIPLLGASRDMGKTIDEAIQSGNANICIQLPKMAHPITAYQYATPTSQVDTLKHLGIRYYNRMTDTQENIIVKATIKAPDHTAQTLTATLGQLSSGAFIVAFTIMFS